MSNKIEFYFDYSSPWTYLAFKGITDLYKKKDFELIWKRYFNNLEKYILN